jgi:DNA-binding phage protein
MARHSRGRNEGLSGDIRKPEFARELALGLVEEGFSVQAALGKVIRAYGVKEFAVKAKMPSPNVLRSIDARHNPTQETLEQLLRPFGLRLAVAPSGRRGSTAA